MKSILLVFVLSLTGSLSARAERPACEDWPRLVAGSGPASGLTGLPITYNFRLNCRPQPQFELVEFAGAYQTPDAQLTPEEGLIVHPLPSGDWLYQSLFTVPAAQPPGLYEISGCLRVRRVSDHAEMCVELIRSSFRLEARR